MSSSLLRKEFIEQLILDLEILSNILGILGIGSSMLPILIFSRARLVNNKLLFFFTLEMLVVNLITFILFIFTTLNQDLFIFFHVFVSSILLNSIILKWSKKFKYLKIIAQFNLFLIFLSFLVISLYPKLDLEDKLSLFSTILNLSFSMVSIFSIITCYKNSLYDTLLEDQLFVLSSGVLLYFGLQLYVISFESIIRENGDFLFYITWPIVQVSTILYHLLIAGAIWKLKR